MRAVRNVRLTFGAGIALIVAVGALTLTHSPPRVVKKGVKATYLAATISGAAALCQANEALPAGVSAIRLSLEAFFGSKVRITAYQGSRVIAEGRRSADWRLRRGGILVPYRFGLYAAALQIHLPACDRAAVHRRQHAVRQLVQSLRSGAVRAQGEAQGQEGAAHPRIQSRQAGRLLRRHIGHPAPLPPGVHHAP